MRNLGTPKPKLLHSLYSTTTTHPLEQSVPRRRGKLVPILIVFSALFVAVMLVLLSIGLGAFLPRSLFAGNASSPGAAANQVVGQVLFSSSGQISEASSQGIADEVDLDLSNLPAPAAGKNYYAWLLFDDPVEGEAVPLGQLHINHGAVHLHYSGDAQHSNLLEVTNRLLVTEEDATTTPNFPSLDSRTWRYIARFPQTPSPLDTVHHYSLLSHLRHLLAADPTLKELGMPGGLDIWLFRNVQKILEWSGSARDDWASQDTALMRRHFIRLLDYLDGAAYVQNDVPAGTPLLVNPTIARVSLLELDVQRQEPPGLLYHIDLHLHGMVQSPGATAGQKQLAIQIDTALTKVKALLEQIRSDARQLVMMTGTQLLQASSLSILDDMVKRAQDAFIGQFNPATGEIQDGITEIHYAIQRLATMEVTVAPQPAAGIALQGLLSPTGRGYAYIARASGCVGTTGGCGSGRGGLVLVPSARTRDPSFSPTFHEQEV